MANQFIKIDHISNNIENSFREDSILILADTATRSFSVQFPFAPTNRTLFVTIRNNSANTLTVLFYKSSPYNGTSGLVYSFTLSGLVTRNLVNDNNRNWFSI